MKIIDEKIKPYSINLNSDNYDVIEDTGRLDKKEQIIYKTHGHYSSTEGALNKIVKLMVEKDESVYTIKEYIEALKLTKINITE